MAKKNDRRNLFRIAARQEWKCYWCGCAIGESTATREHLVPRSRGGYGGDSNVVAACFECNNRRGDGDSPPADYLEHRKVAVARSDPVEPPRAVRVIDGSLVRAPPPSKRELDRRREMSRRGGNFEKWCATFADVWPPKKNFSEI